MDLDNQKIQKSGHSSKISSVMSSMDDRKDGILMHRDETSSSSSQSSDDDSVSRNEINESQSKAQLLTNVKRQDSKLKRNN